jgi:hypothetical protein
MTSLHTVMAPKFECAASDGWEVETKQSVQFDQWVQKSAEGSIGRSMNQKFKHFT